MGLFAKFKNLFSVEPVEEKEKELKNEICHYCQISLPPETPRCHQCHNLTTYGQSLEEEKEFKRELRRNIASMGPGPMHSRLDSLRSGDDEDF